MTLKQVVKIVRKGNTGYKKIYSIIKLDKNITKNKIKKNKRSR